jgi:hypothetical protein
MAVIRVNKTSNYTVMSNTHLREKNMSLKAKGLLSVMLSLPDTWDYSIAGLVAISKENETAIKSTLNELKEFGYLHIKKLMPNETASGRIEYIYDVFETPQDSEKQTVEKQGVENLPVEILPVENQGQINTNRVNTEKVNTKRENTKYIRHKYGEYNNVLLTDEDMEKLKAEFPNDYNSRIDNLSMYIASTGKTYKNHLATIRNWARNEKRKEQPKKDNNPTWTIPGLIEL